MRSETANFVSKAIDAPSILSPLSRWAKPLTEHNPLSLRRINGLEWVLPSLVEERQWTSTQLVEKIDASTVEKLVTSNMIVLTRPRQSSMLEHSLWINR